MHLSSLLSLAILSRAVVGGGFYNQYTVTSGGALSKTILTAKCAGTSTQVNLSGCVGNNNGLLAKG